MSKNFGSAGRAETRDESSCSITIRTLLLNLNMSWVLEARVLYPLSLIRGLIIVSLVVFVFVSLLLANKRCFPAARFGLLRAASLCSRRRH
jgi:hypothetical protein